MYQPGQVVVMQQPTQYAVVQQPVYAYQQPMMAPMPAAAYPNMGYQTGAYPQYQQQ